MTKNRAVYLALSGILSILLIAFLLSQVQARDFALTLRQISWPALLLYLVFGLLAAWLRAWRYKWLLHPRPISWGNMFLVTFIRNAFTDLLPARIGSLSYIYVLNKRLGFSFESAASTFVVSFIFDFLTLSPFIVAAVLAVGFGASGVPSTALLAVSVLYFLVIVILTWKLVPVSLFLLKAYKAFIKAIKAGNKKKARSSVEKLQMTIESLQDIRARKIFLPVFVISLFIRLGKYVSLYALLFALLQSHGLALQDLSFWKTILGITGAEMTSFLPLKGLADFGTWESAWTLAFQLMKFDRSLAVLSGLGVHFITNLWEYSLAFISILILAFPYFKRRRLPL